MNRLKGWIYDMAGWLATAGSRPPVQKTILVVRLDEIGDFMLWHKFLPEIVDAPAYTGYSFHLYANSSWKSLYDRFYSDLPVEVTWVNKTQFKKDIKYRLNILRSAYHLHSEIVINPAYSRDKRNDDAIVAAARAQVRIGMKSNTESVKSYEKGYDQKLYTRLFDLPQRPVFEFYRNSAFTDFVTGSSNSIRDTSVDPGRLPSLSFTLPEKYFVVFPGSRSKARIWPTDHFAAVSTHLHQRYGFTALVCGGPGDIEYTNAFCAAYTGPKLDLTGKTSLPEMLTIFAHASCLVSVDTGSVHLAAAAGCTVFGIFNGSQYKRFAPYPQNMHPGFFAIYPDEIEEDLADPQLVKEKYEFVISVPYASVKAEKVIAATEKATSFLRPAFS
ncbi:ADP-heptose:LPS heptosyltransferase [Sediminibacterium ginsengisoli]|uniref:ADP-heptose:LPS heptosyltransferase n=2 Tax=Sediminibacterium ginsengisoli TaxID=413434 RepID=A0A1T4LDP6_9BACT|nr:ADP-heptose:LPS heptosyltransferase [Sediminibacterium ginsengisoli]